jgi:formylglycine-generating enzyme required for sulfatase activity
MKLAVVPAGEFEMGISAAETRRLENEWNITQEALAGHEPAHAVKISAPFLMGKYEVTVGQFSQFVKETGYRTVAETQGWGWLYDKTKKHWVKKSGASWRNPGYQVFDDHPVTLVCHRDAEAFCQWLAARDRRRYFLPTEAQWEYAARGGKRGTRFPWGDDYPDGHKLNLADRNAAVPWNDRTIDDGHAGPAPIGSYEPNGFWLYDMAGNVWELCSDFYDAKAYEKYSSGVAVDPQGPAKGATKVVRGGNWAFEALIATNFYRFGAAPDLCVDICGFRVAAVALADEATRSAGLEQEVSRDLSLDARMTRLLQQVKELTASGRRSEARRLVDKFLEASPKTGLSPGQPQLGSVLDSLIDLTRDRSLESFTNSVEMKMVRIPVGAFVMGSSDTDVGWAMATLARDQPVSLENELPFHKIRISRPFFIAATPVTVAQFRTFTEETGYITDAEDAGGGDVWNDRDNTFERKAGSSWRNPGWKVQDDQPVVMISYNDAQAFVDWLSAREKLPYKLPTEAQWEYAARGGLPMSQFPWGDALPDGRKANYADKNTSYAWRDRLADDGHQYVAPVGTYEANGYGLYDMAGNVLQWVRDHYGEDYYRFSPDVDPEGPGHGENRVMKGGSWLFGPVNLRCAFRGWARPEMAFFNAGFRVAIELANARRPVHFASNFLTKEWVPGADQREVTAALSREKERMGRSAAAAQKTVSASPAKSEQPLLIDGVKVLGFTPKSDGKKAGLAVGDVIIEYQGVRDLTSEKLLSLTGTTKKRRSKVSLVFVRDGLEHAIQVGPGALGVSMVNARVKAPARRPEPRREDPPDRDDKKRGPQWT